MRTWPLQSTFQPKYITGRKKNNKNNSSQRHVKIKNIVSRNIMYLLVIMWSASQYHFDNMRVGYFVIFGTHKEHHLFLIAS